MPPTLPELVTLLVLNQVLFSILVEIPVLPVLPTLTKPVTLLATHKDSTPLLFQPPLTESPPLPAHVTLVEPEP